MRPNLRWSGCPRNAAGTAQVSIVKPSASQVKPPQILVELILLQRRKK